MTRIDDGFPTTIDIFDNESDVTAAIVKFWEKSVTPPGIVGGGANDTTTMRNTKWRTMNAKKLRTLGEATLRVAYDPEIYDSIVDPTTGLLQQNKFIVVNWPDGSKLKFWGFIDEFTPAEVREGEQPEADIKIIPTNQDDTGAEVAPDYVAPSPGP